MPSPTVEGRRRGPLMPIGGAEEKTRDARVLRRFIAECGERPKIAVIPTASMRRDTGSEYRSLFLELGAAEVDVLAITEREHCAADHTLEVVGRADGVFMTGGNQMRLSTTLGGTPLAKLLRRMNAQGQVIAGTSAGAAIMSQHMIASGEEGATPREGMVRLAPGLGFTNKYLVDQHFKQRDRLGRLLTALAYNPFAVGLGIDEDTAVVISPENVLEVVGSGGVTVIDPSHLKHSGIDEADFGAPVSLIDVRLHVLIEGNRFDFNKRFAYTR